MPMIMHDDGSDLVRFEIRGMLHKADFKRCEAELEARIERLGPVKVLFVLDRFTGWNPTDRWSDLSFYAKNADAIQRIAIVGDERWRSETLMFAGADLRKGPVRFFPTAHAPVAHAWLSGG